MTAYDIRISDRGSDVCSSDRVRAGTAGHAMDWDDTQLAEGPGRPYGLLMHPTVPPLAAALAVSDLVAAEEGRPLAGKRFLTAFTAGFEVASNNPAAIETDPTMPAFPTPGPTAPSSPAPTAR